jgi:DNA-binding response OmpR family regulator
MPGPSGYELCRKIKDDPAKRNVPVILLTSLGDPLDNIQGLVSGGDNFITKPYEPDYLLDRIRTILNNKALRTEGKLKVGAEVTSNTRHCQPLHNNNDLLSSIVAIQQEIATAELHSKMSCT